MWLTTIRRDVDNFAAGAVYLATNDAIFFYLCPGRGAVPASRRPCFPGERVEIAVVVPSAAELWLQIAAWMSRTALIGPANGLL